MGLRGELLDHLPAAPGAQAAANRNTRRWRAGPARPAARAPGRELPAQAIKYVRRIEELVEAPVTLLSTSPERDDTILMKDPFEG